MTSLRGILLIDLSKEKLCMKLSITTGNYKHISVSKLFGSELVSLSTRLSLLVNKLFNEESLEGIDKMVNQLIFPISNLKVIICIGIYLDSYQKRLLSTDAIDEVS